MFAEKGYEGGSTREICTRAETSINMVHHYFGNKAGLLEAIVERYSDEVLVLPLKLLSAPVRSAEDLRARVELLVETTLDACLEHRDLVVVVMREAMSPSALADYITCFGAFLEAAQDQGFVRSDLAVDMVTGAIMDRILNQVLYIPSIRGTSGADIHDPDYRHRWCVSNVDLFLRGIAPPTDPAR